MSKPNPTANPAARKARWLRFGALGAVMLIPLAFAGLFVSAISNAGTVLESIPAAIVNEDSLITTTAADGTVTNIFAGRLLVSELTSGDSQGFDWTITNAADAEKALANGDVYAVLTVPSNFSTSIMSISTDTPVKADISIRTDDAHSYLTGSVAQVVGESMTNTFGKAITSQYISGIYSSLGTVGESLSTAADGAGQLSSGASSLSDGLDSLTGGAASAAGGARSLSSGLSQYTAGVTSLSSGLAQLSAGSGVLSLVNSDVSGYTATVASLSGRLAAANAALQADPTDAAALVSLASVSSDLNAAAVTGYTLAPTTAGRTGAIQGGIADSAAGAATLAAGSGQLTSGASSLASGLGGLTSGASSAASGAGALASGATALATGLSDGAAQVPSFDAEQSAASAAVASDPVTLSVTTDNKVGDIGQAIATLLVPLGLWIGALAVFLVLRPVTRRALASTANNRRLVYSALARASLVTGAQALLLTALLHVSLGVDWALLPATFGFSLLMALAFTAFHYLLTIGLGRAGLVVSLFLLAVQLTSTGGIYPIEVLATPLQWISPFLPLTHGVAGMQAIISGGDVGTVIGAAVALAAFLLGSVLVALAATGRSRRAVSLGLVPSRA